MTRMSFFDADSGKLFDKAVRIASEAHEGQLDLNGQPYLLHILRVGLAGSNDLEKIVGILHDVIEDSDYTYEDLMKWGFPELIGAYVRILTRDKEKECYESYIIRVSAHPIARRVKLNDLEDNLRPERTGAISESLLLRYRKAYSFLMSEEMEANRKELGQ